MSDTQVIDTRADIRLDAWRGVFEKTNRILSGQRVTVTIVPPGECPSNMAEVPGWSDGTNIHLNGTQISKMLRNKDTLSAVLRLKGLNYHELCHVLYTPRMSDELPRRIMDRVRQSGDPSWWYAFNALEDQRIETWFTATYSASRRYFEATVLEWILLNGSAESAILIYGRKYLSPRIRVQAGRVFRKKYDKALYAEFQTVIDEYVTLVLPQDSIKAQQCVVRYHELLKKMQAASGSPLPTLVIMDNGMGGHVHGTPDKGAPDVARTGRVLQKEAKRARDKAANATEEAIDADIAEEERRDEEDAADGAGQGDSPDGGEPGDQGGDGSSASAADGTDQDTGGDAKGGVSDTGSSDNHTGRSNDQSLKDEIDDMVSTAESAMDEVRSDDWVQEDAKNLLDAVKARQQSANMEARGANAKNAVHIEPDEGTKQAVRRIRTIVTRIRQDAEPETLRRQHSGRVDARRALQRQPHEVDVFKTWDVGHEEETGMEAVLLVDVSGSMEHRMRDASGAMWAFKRSFDMLDIRCTVMLFDTNHFILWQPSERAPGGGVPQVNSRGGTDPTSALYQAMRILTKSAQPNRVLVTVTDGGWGGDPKEQARIMRTMHQKGVTSMLLGLDRACTSYGKHDHTEGHDIETMRDLAKVAQKLVAGIMRAAGTV